MFLHLTNVFGASTVPKSSAYRCEHGQSSYPHGAVVYWTDVIINEKFINRVIDIMIVSTCLMNKLKFHRNNGVGIK